MGKQNYRVGGNRGGSDRFKWDDVKDDQYRENYLGHSLRAPVGRWQKNKDLTWWSKQGKNLSKEERREMLQAEIRAVKEQEEIAMNAALGLAPIMGKNTHHALDEFEKKKLLDGSTFLRDEKDVNRVEGLGAAPMPMYGQVTKSVLPGTTDLINGGDFDHVLSVTYSKENKIDEDGHNRKSKKSKKSKEKKSKKEKKRKKKKSSTDKEKSDDRTGISADEHIEKRKVDNCKDSDHKDKSNVTSVSHSRRYDSSDNESNHSGSHKESSRTNRPRDVRSERSRSRSRDISRRYRDYSDRSESRSPPRREYTSRRSTSHRGRRSFSRSTSRSPPRRRR